MHEASTNIPPYCTVSYCTLGNVQWRTALTCLGADVCPAFVMHIMYMYNSLAKHFSAKKLDDK